MALERLGPYKLEKLLGRGGMGTVSVGLNEATGERAAVKLLSSHLADDPAFRDRFKQEIETLEAAPESSQHRSAPRLWRRGRTSLLRDGIDRRPQPAG